MRGRTGPGAKRRAGASRRRSRRGCSGRSWTLGLNMRKQLHPAGKGLVRKLQKGVRSRLGTMHIMAKLKREKEAAIVLQCLFRGNKAVARVVALRLAKKLLKEKKGREAEAIRMKQALYIRWRNRVLKHWIRSDKCDKLGQRFNCSIAFRQWGIAIDAYKFERHVLHTAASERIAKVGRRYVYAQRFKGKVHIYSMAKRIQNSLVRIALAKSVFSYKLARRNAARDIQRVYRGGCRRDVIREWNRHELLAHAYANAARLLIKHNRGARKIQSLRTTEALITKHEKDGDSAIHRAARGIGDQSVYACIKHLNLAADAYNDAGSAPLAHHRVGLRSTSQDRSHQEERKKKGEGGRAGGRRRAGNLPGLRKDGHHLQKQGRTHRRGQEQRHLRLARAVAARRIRLETTYKRSFIRRRPRLRLRGIRHIKT